MSDAEWSNILTTRTWYYRKPDFTLALTRETWAKPHLNQATVAQLASAGELKVTGDATACDRVLDLFDKFGVA